MHYFLHFGVHENAFTITQNALILQLLGASPPDTQQGLRPLHPAGGTALNPLRSPNTIFSVRH